VANSHFRGNGCPQCGKILSKGMKQVISTLEQLKSIGFIQDYALEKTFKEMKYKENGRLYLDAYIDELHVGIEYDGEQHFRPIEFFGGIESLKLGMKRDIIKDTYCLKSRMNLLRIPFTIKLDQIPIIIIEFLKQCKEKLVYCSYEHYSNVIDSKMKENHTIITQKIF